MGIYRGLDTDEGWIQRRLAAIERDLAELAAARRLQASTIGKGGITVGDGGGIIIQGGGDLRILDAAGNVVFSAADGPVRTEWAQNDSGNINLSAGFTRYLDTNVTVPVGYTQAIVQVFASAGVTYAGTSTGNIGIQARATGSATTAAGPALSSNKTGGGAISVNTGLATKLAVAAGTPLVIHAFAYADGATPVNLTGNVHLSATVIFTRS